MEAVQGPFVPHRRCIIPKASIKNELRVYIISRRDVNVETETHQDF